MLTDGLLVLAVAAILSGILPTSTIAETNTVVETAPRGAGVPPPGVQAPPLAPKELNDPLPPSEMPRPNTPGVVTPRGVPQGMGNEVDMTKTPGDDDPSDGVDEPGRDPVPGLPRPAPGMNNP
jgi:hypothetical protein